MNFLRASMLVATFMIVGRISGFLREIVIAQIAGASQESDVVIVLLTFPDMMISLVLGGGLMAALVPSFRSLPKEAGFALFLRASLVIVLFFGLLALSIALFPLAVLGILAPGWKQGLVTETIPLFRTMLIAIPFAALSGVVVAFLNSKERFTFEAIGTLIFNCMVILSLLVFTSLSVSAAVVIGILTGITLRLAIQLVASRRFWVVPNFVLPYDRSRLLRRFYGSFGFFSILALLPPIVRAYASVVEPGALSIFNYSYKLMELPMAIVVTAIVTVLLPRLSGHVRSNEQKQAVLTLGMAIRATIVLLLSIAIATIFQAETVARVAFFGAAFTAEQFYDFGRILSIGLLCLPFQGLVVLFGTAFVSYDRTGLLVIVSLVMLLVMTSLGLFLSAKWGINGLMLAYVLTQVTGALLLTLILLFIIGRQPIVIALRRPLRSILLPGVVCLSISYIFRETGFWGPPALILSVGAFLAVHVVSDLTNFKKIINGQN